jgi:cobalt-zinc-cadmium efflux system membrane fusion protein
VQPAFSRVAGRAIPNLLVLMALGGLAFWGHETAWTLPAFAHLTGSSDDGLDDWCADHAVPESVCVECNPRLMPRGPSYGWCKVHGVHECPLEHPDVAQLEYPPEVSPADLDRAQKALAFAVRRPNSPKCKMHARRVQFASDAAVARAGVDVVAAWQQPVTEAIAAPGEIGYDPTRVANLSAPITGKVWQVRCEVGQQIKKGDVLALVDAAEVGKVKGELLRGLVLRDARSRTLRAQAELAQSGATSTASLRKAQAEFSEAQLLVVGAQQALINLGLPISVEKLEGLSADALGQRIRFLGLPDAIARGLDPQTTTANLIPVVAPLDGTVVRRTVVVGEQAEPARVLFVVADPRQVWLTLQVRQEDAKRLRAHDASTGTSGQTVRFLPTGADREVAGEVVWVSTAIDDKTRTVQVRANLPNPDGQLRAGAFGSGRIILREEPKAVVVPAEAVQWEGDCHVVFVRDKHYEKPGAYKVFHTRTVRPGATDGGVTEIIAGVLPGEVVVTKGSGVMRSELLKNSLGEG